MLIQKNIDVINAYRKLDADPAKQDYSTEEPSSGNKVNWSADYEAGLVISEKIRARIRELSVTANNIRDVVDYIQSARSALSEIEKRLQCMRELSVCAAKDITTDKDRVNLDAEFQQLKREIDEIALQV